MITAEQLRNVLTYNKRTGIFRWKNRKNIRPSVNARLRGRIAGAPDADGYIQITILGENHKAHRLAWLYIHGEWPSCDLDHRNTKKHHNPIANLRLATTSQNGANRGLPENNTSGFKGVYFNKGVQKWHAQIKHHGVRHYLGIYNTPETAYAAYCDAAKELQKDFARL